MGQAVQISTASVPADYCPGSFREAWPFGVSLLVAELTGDGIIPSVGPTTPAPDDQNRPWFRINADGTPDRWYVYSNGAWIAKHPMAAGAVIMYEGSEASIDTYDGGEAGTVTATTGPMWEKVDEMDGRFPIGPGTVGSTSIGVGDTGGTHEHTLTLEEIPAHTHPFTGADYVGSGNAGLKVIIDDDTGSSSTTINPSAGGQSDGTTKPVNTMPPYLGIFFIRKTARTHYRI